MKAGDGQEQDNYLHGQVLVIHYIYLEVVSVEKSLLIREYLVIIKVQENNLWNDLWAFNVATGNWTWIGGSSTPLQEEISTGVNAAPGARYGATMRVSATGFIYLFGGYGIGPAGGIVNNKKLKKRKRKRREKKE